MAGLLLVLVSMSMLVSCPANPEPVTPTQLLPASPTSNAVLSAAETPSPTVLPTQTPIPTAKPSPTQMPRPTATAINWGEGLSRIVWVAYSPPSSNPNEGVEATVEAIRADLAVLRQAGFTGLVTYGSSGVMGREFPDVAQSLGFQGLIMGVWDPFSPEEMAAVKAAAQLPIVLAFCVGNEGLGQRYQLPALSAAMQSLREVTGKPVVTTEQIDDYSDEALLQLGDWVFPNVHPYFHNQLEPSAAVRWTQAAYDDLKRRTDRFVLFKEVGLPTAGDPQGRLSETAQEQYYLELAKTDVRFVYFEAFDQPWKTHLPVEPHWGIFQSDRTPKRLGWRLMGKEPAPSATPVAPFYVYQDADSPDNHYKPTGYMGDVGDIRVSEAFGENPHSGKHAIRVVYGAKGKGPNECAYAPPCKWAGVYWQEPPNNWGTDPVLKGRGLDLSRYNRLLFWARADRLTKIEFLVGGIAEAYGDSLVYPRERIVGLDQTWREFEIDLSEADLTHIIGGFAWVTNWDTNPGGATFYLDDIRFEQRESPVGPSPTPTSPTSTSASATSVEGIRPRILELKHFAYYRWEPSTPPAMRDWPQVIPVEALDEHFAMAGFIGPTQIIEADREWKKDCHSPHTCDRFMHTPRSWASTGLLGKLWTDPSYPQYSLGVNLSDVKRLTFWAKGEKGGEKIEFRVGSTAGQMPQPLFSTGIIALDTSWQRYSIEFTNRENLDYVFSGFSWLTTTDLNPEGFVFYLDDMLFE